MIRFQIFHFIFLLRKAKVTQRIEAPEQTDLRNEFDKSEVPLESNGGAVEMHDIEPAAATPNAFCVNCGTKATAEFCTECGTKIAQ